MDNQIENLSISLTASAASATSAIDRVIASAKRLGGASTRASGGVDRLSGSARDMGTAVSKARDETGKTEQKVRSFGDKLKNLASSASTINRKLKDITSGIKSIGSAMLAVPKYFGGKLIDNIKESAKGMNSFLSSIKRIAFYRAIRSVMKEITQGFSEGIKNLYAWSNEVNGHFAASMDRLASSTLYLKNSFAAMASPLIEALVPAIDFIIDKFVDLFNVINQVFARLSGRTSYTAAKKVSTQWGDAAKSASGSAKKAADEIKRTILSFDEINKLNDNNKSSGSGGGGSGSAGASGGMMFENRPISSWIQEMVDGGDFSILGTKIADKINNALASINWDRIRERASNVTRSITSMINGFIEAIDPNIIARTLAEVINTATTTIDQFWSSTKWALAGTKIRKAIVQFFKDINVVSAANAFVAPFASIATLIYNAIPKDKEEWDIIGNRIAIFLSAAIHRIPWTTIGDGIGKLLVGAMNVMKILAEEKTLTHIAEGIKSAIQKACENITPEQVQGWVSAVLKDVISAVGVLLTFDLKIGDIKTSPIEILTFGALAKAAVSSLLSKVFSSIGIGANGLFTAAISIGLSVSLFAKTFSLAKEAAADGKITLKEMCNIVGTGLMGIGAALIGVNPVAGAIVASIGIVLKLIPTIEFGEIKEKIDGASRKATDVLVEATNKYLLPTLEEQYPDIYKALGGTPGSRISVSSNTDMWDMPAAPNAILRDTSSASTSTQKSYSNLPSPAELTAQGYYNIPTVLNTLQTESTKTFNKIASGSAATAKMITKHYVGNGGVTDSLIGGTKKVDSTASSSLTKFREMVTAKLSEANASSTSELNGLQSNVESIFDRTNAKASQTAASIVSRLSTMNSTIGSNTALTFSQISANVGSSTQTVNSRINSMANSVTTNMNNANRSASNSINGIRNKLISDSEDVSWAVDSSFGNIQNSIVWNVANARNAAGSVSFYNVGANIVNGIYNGISDGWNWLTNTVKNLASNMLSAAKWVLGIRSPSHAFRDEVGKMLTLGAAEGVIDAKPEALKAITELSNSMKDQLSRQMLNATLRGTVLDYTGGMDFNMPRSGDTAQGDDRMDREIALLQALLTEMQAFNEKEFTADITTSGLTRAMNRTNRRAGVTVVPVG